MKLRNYILALLVIVALIPYGMYVIAVVWGISLGSFRIEKYPEAFYHVGQMNLKTLDLFESGIERWQLVHFQNFKVPIPVRNPFYLFMPEADFHLDKVPSMSARFSDRRGNFLFVFKPNGPKKFDYSFPGNPIFSLDAFRKRLRSLPEGTLLRDVFSRQIDVGIFPLSYWKFAYNLYILSIRGKVFPRNIEGITYVYGRQMGIIRMRSVDGRERESVFLSQGDEVFSMDIEADAFQDAANDYRDIFLRAVDIHRSDKDAAVAPYAKFQALPFGRKVSQEGVAYFYASLSHDPDNERFIWEIVSLLEQRRNKTGTYLEFFRDYAFRRHGSRFLEDKKKEAELSSDVAGGGSVADERVPAGRTRRERIHSRLKSRKEDASGVFIVE